MVGDEGLFLGSSEEVTVGYQALDYRLPLSVVRASGTVTITKDTILDKDEAAPEAAMLLDVMGDERVRTIRIDYGWLRDTGVAFELTEDERLVSSAVESTGQAGKAVLAVASVGGALAGLALGAPPVLVAAAGAAMAKVSSEALAFQIRQLEGELSDEEKTDEQKVEEAYEKAHPGVMALSKQYATLVLELNLKMAAAVRELADAADGGDRAAALWRLRNYGQGLAASQAEFERLKQHFKAWRAGTLKSRSEKREYLLSLDLIRAADVTIGDDRKVSFAANPEARKVRKVWEDLGLTVRVIPANGKDMHVPDAAENVILARVPRWVRLDVYKKGDNDEALLIESKPHLVVDGMSAIKKVKLRKSLWAKRSATLKFSESGALTGYASTATAAAAAFAETVQGVPAAVASSLEQSKKIYDQVEALRTRSLDQRLARVKKEVELKEQELTREGLLATAGSHAELERLKQEASILEQRDKIAGFGPPSEHSAELSNLKQQIELLTAKYDLAVAQRALASESELGEIWREIERLGAREVRDQLGAGDGTSGGGN